MLRSVRAYTSEDQARASQIHPETKGDHAFSLDPASSPTVVQFALPCSLQAGREAGNYELLRYRHEEAFRRGDAEGG